MIKAETDMTIHAKEIYGLVRDSLMHQSAHDLRIALKQFYLHAIEGSEQF